MLDSFGKMQPGILMVNFHSPGFFDECKSVGRDSSFGMIPENVTFNSQYCSMNLIAKITGMPMPVSTVHVLIKPEILTNESLKDFIYLLAHLNREFNHNFFQLPSVCPFNRSPRLKWAFLIEECVASLSVVFKLFHFKLLL